MNYLYLDEAIAEEMKDLINDDVEEEEEDSEDDIGHHGHKRSREEDELEEDLEDDDYDLIEENLGRRIDRKKKFRRIRRLEDDDEDEDEEKHNINDREAIANELFQNDDYDTSSRHSPERDRLDHRPLNERFDEIDSEHSEDEDDNFIVDDNDQPINTTRQRSRKSEQFTDQALQQAQDVFGVDFDYDEVNNFNEDDDFDEEGENEYAEDGTDSRDRSMSSKKKKKKARKSIFELYEPAELERNHLTSVDNDIRNNDMPERFQLRTFPVTPCNEVEIRQEAQWIYKNLYSIDMITRQEKINSTGRSPFGGRKPESVLCDIVDVLNFIRNDSLEVPFIAFYRKDYFSNDTNIHDLWLIYRWDEKWCQLQERKKNLLKLLENMQNYQLALIMQNHDQPLPDNFRRITERDIRRIESIESFEEFTDYYLNFQLYYSKDMPEMKKYIIDQRREEKARKKLQTILELEDSEIKTEEPEEDEEEIELTERMGFLKLSMRRDTYSVCNEYGIGGLAAKFGLTPEQFGEHLLEGYHKHELEQLEFDPIDAANEHLSKRFNTPERALEAATFMVGRQLSCDPSVRKTVRQVFYERAKINAKPTKRGIKEIDESHYCYTLKYLENKPISSFVNEQFLLLQNAKNEGLMQFTITIDEDNRNNQSYLDEIKYLYHRVSTSNIIIINSYNRELIYYLRMNSVIMFKIGMLNEVKHLRLL